jgi:uncharacterized membrane protein YczE
MISLGLALMLRSDLGMGSWGAFEQALAQLTGMTFGRISQLVGFSLVALAFFMRIPPTVVTLLNMIFIGLFADWWLALIPAAHGLSGQVLLFTLGLIIYSFGIGGYLAVNLGAGPRDSMMLGLSRTTGMSMRAARISVDVSLLVAAWLMRGPVGVGTAAMAFGSGPLVQFFFMRLRGPIRGWSGTA